MVNNFIHVPFKLEECLTFGLALCTDSFLYAVTFLPLRVFLSALLAFTSFVYPRCVANPCSSDPPPLQHRLICCCVRSLSCVCVPWPQTSPRLPPEQRVRPDARADRGDRLPGPADPADLTCVPLYPGTGEHAVTTELVCSETSCRTHHWLRCGCGVLVNVQATIKLYVLTAMFEILDKLMISFGQDTLDSLYWSAKKNSDRK